MAQAIQAKSCCVRSSVKVGSNEKEDNEDACNRTATADEGCPILGDDRVVVVVVVDAHDGGGGTGINCRLLPRATGTKLDAATSIFINNNNSNKNDADNVCIHIHHRINGNLWKSSRKNRLGRLLLHLFIVLQIS